MITLLINGQPRNDIKIMTGGSLSTTEAHVSSSSLTVEISIANEPLKEFDYIEIMDGTTYIFAGTILSVKQQSLDNINLTFQIFDLTIASNADFMSTIFADLGFPEGASATQILLGNQPGDDWYSSSLGSFYGLNYRIEQQGIAVSQIDRFDDVILEQPSYLWGQKMYDVLNTLADVCGAYWVITYDRQFMFQSQASTTFAPESVDKNSTTYGIEVERDAYTMYSAVRVVGGEGRSAIVHSGIAPDNWVDPFPVDGIWTRTSDTVITSAYPIATINYPIAQVCTSGLPSGVPAQVNVGFKGLHDDDSNYQALTSYNGTEIEMKDGYTWLNVTTLDGFISVAAQFIVNVYVRLVDNALASEISNQRGGTGIVEYLYEDTNINSFSDAALTADAFMQNNSKRAKTIKFKSLLPGWEVGQTVFVNLPYYGIKESFYITATTAKTVLSQNNTTTWETEIEASNIYYRDKFSTLYYTPQKVTFSFASDFGATEGLFFKDDISIQSTISAYMTGNGQVITWAVWQQLYPSWIVFQQNVASWGTFENLELRWEAVGNYLQPWAKQKIINLLSGQGTANDTILMNVTIGGMYVNLQDGSTNNIALQSTPIITQDSITATYYLMPAQLQEYLVSGYFRSTDPTSGQNMVIEEFPLNIDRTPSNPMGEYALTIVVRHSII